LARFTPRGCRILKLNGWSDNITTCLMTYNRQGCQSNQAGRGIADHILARRGSRRTIVIPRCWVCCASISTAAEEKTVAFCMAAFGDHGSCELPILITNCQPRLITVSVRVNGHLTKTLELHSLIPPLIWPQLITRLLRWSC